MIAHSQLMYQVIMFWTAELINSELKCLDRWLKSNKISINAEKTKHILFSYNKNVNFPDINVGNKTINETSVTKFFGIHNNNIP